MLKILITSVGIYLMLCLLAYCLQHKLVFQPHKGGGRITPADIGLEFENLKFAVGPDVELHGWYVPAARQNEHSPVVLFCHGNAGNLTHRLETVRLIHSLDCNLLIFDYQGYGLSQGTPSEAATYADVEAAWTLLVRDKKIEPERIILWGRSLGGAIAARCAQQHSPCALVLESTFTSIPDIGARMYPFFPVRLLCRLRYDTRRLLASIRCPLLVIHSPDDSVVPYVFGKQLYEAAAGQKAFLKIQGDHNDGFLVSEQQYTAGIKHFFQTLTVCAQKRGQP